MSSARRHVVIVGGGITGSYAAYFLARNGVATTLIERAGIAHGASGFNPGGLNPLHGTGVPGPLQAFQWESFELSLEHMEKIKGLSGIDPAAQRYSRVHIALGDEDLGALDTARGLHEAAPGFSARWVEKKELLELEPRLNPALIRGMRAEGNGKIEAADYTRAVAGAAEKLGAKVVADEAIGLESDGRRVTGVRLGKIGSLSCDGLIVATGPWTAAPSEWLEFSIPLEPLKGDLLFVRAGGAPIQHNYSWRDAAIYGNGTNEVWLGGTEERAGFDRTPGDRARESIIGRACRIFPSMKEAVVLKHGAALRPMASDDMPIVGWAPGWDNAVLALGGGRKGMLVGAGMGKAAADLLARGETALSIAPCSPGRFGPKNSK